MWLDDKVQWTREESLSTIALAEFVELPERKAIQSSAAASENIVSRVLRHISDAQVGSFLPHFLHGELTYRHLIRVSLATSWDLPNGLPPHLMPPSPPRFPMTLDSTVTNLGSRKSSSLLPNTERYLALTRAMDMLSGAGSLDSVRLPALEV